MYPDAPDDFADPFDGSVYERSWDSLFHALDYRLVLLVLLIIAVSAVLGWGLGYLAGRYLYCKRLKASARHIYGSIAWHLKRAAEAGGGLQLQYAREFLAIIEARLGHVRILHQKSGRLFDELRKVLEAADPPVGAAPKPHRVTYDKTINQQSIEVWQALHDFKAVWDDEPKIRALIEAAQADVGRRVMCKTISVPVTHASVKSPAASVERPAMSPQTEPVPTAGGRKRKPLPKHKKNMLA